jgi:hypothetical protein
MKSTTELLQMNARLSNDLDSAASDPERARFLLRARRAVRSELEARHAAAERQAEPYRFVGMSDDGLAIYEG